MRVLVTRPLDDALCTARALEAAGHEAIVAPVLQIESLHANLPAGPFDFVAATSASAFDCLDQDVVADCRWRHTPVCAVGERTAASARRRGFANIAAIEPNAASLAKSMCAAANGSRVVYLAGTSRKSTLETSLAASGLVVTVIETYSAVTAQTLGADATAAIRDSKIDAVLHYSRRSAAVFAGLVRNAGIATQAAAMTHVCLSDDVAAGLAELAPARTVWPAKAGAAGQETIFDLLGATLSRPPQLP